MEDAFKQPANALQMWTDQDLARLARLMKKYPVGTVDRSVVPYLTARVTVIAVPLLTLTFRWEKIAEVMERLPWEVTKMARKIKDVGFQVVTQQKCS